jgi:hypothetical protein
LPGGPGRSYTTTQGVIVKTPRVLLFAASIVWIAAAACSSAPRQYDDAGAPDGGVEDAMPGWKLSWAVRAGGDEHGESDPPWPMFREGGNAIAALDDGSVYLVGQVAETAVFGQGEPNETVFPDHLGWSDGFIARYEPDGALAWVRRIGGADIGTGECANDVATLADGSAVVVGRLDAPEVVLGEGEPNETVLTSTSWVNAYVARYAPNGDLDWAVQIPKAEGSHMYGWTVHALPGGGILVGGTLLGTAWPWGKSAISSLPSEDASNNWDGFLAWFDEDGNVYQSRRIGGDAQIFSFHSVDVTEDGDVVVAAIYDKHGDEIFGLGEPNETVLHCENDFSSCASLARYDSEGRLEWVRDLRIFNLASTMSIAVLENGDIGLATRFARSSDPDGDGVFYDLGDSHDVYGAVVAVYGALDGGLQWARMGSNEGHTSYGMGTSVFAVPGGGLIAGFAFEQSLTFEGNDDGQRILTSAGKQDIALMSLSASGEIRWMHRMGGEGRMDIPMAGAQLDDTSLWLTGAYASNPFVATSGNGDDIALPLSGYTDVFLMRFDATSPPAE